MSGSDSNLPSRALLDEIYAYALAGHPEEVCGFVVAAGGAADSPYGSVRCCDNRQNQLHADDPETFPRDARTAYNLGPKDLLFLDKSLRADSAARVRIIFHSHCDVGAYFSDEDVRAATFDGEPLFPVDYLVVDVQKDGVRGSKLYRFVDGKFVEIGADSVT